MTNNHWTSENLADFVYWITSDFVSQIELRMEEKGINKTEFANLISRSASQVSQVLNNPGNLELESVVRFARGLGMKVSLVAYDDSDPANDQGPIHSSVFSQCWERLNQPRNQDDLDDIKAWVVHTTAQTETTKTKSNMFVKVEKLAKTDNIGKIYA